MAPFENFRPRCAARCFLTQLRRLSVREEAPSPPIGPDQAFLRTQTILKRGGNMRFKDGRMRISWSVLPIKVRVVSRLSYIVEKLQVGEFLPPCCFLLSVPLNSRAAEWATAGKKERKPFASLASLPSVQYSPRTDAGGIGWCCARHF